jgi:UDP-glucose 4-epimerase
MRTLVTGGAGFIGSHVVDALVERGDEVTVLDDVSTGRRKNLEQAVAGGAEVVDGDIRDGEAVSQLCERVRPEAIFHLAAQIDVRKSVADPAFDARVNVEGTINVLRAAQANGVGRVVNTSSGGAIYGEGQTIPAPEDHPVAPMAPYGMSKFCGESYCDMFGRLHGLSTISLRYGNVYGPRQDPLGEAGVIAIFCGRLISGERPTVYGDGRQTRDYTYVADIVAANLAAASHPEAGGVYNVGTGRAASVLEVLAALRRAAGLAEDELQPEFAPARLGELQRSALDVGRARAELGFTAEAGLDDGMRRTLAWARAAAAAA